MLAKREDILPLIDALLGGESPVVEKRRALHLLCVIAEGYPREALTPERVAALLPGLLWTDDQWILRSAAYLLQRSADSGSLADSGPLLAAIRDSFSRTGNPDLGYLLVRLAPDDPDTEKVIETGSERSGDRDRRALLAAAGDGPSLVAILKELDLDSTSEDRELYLRRVKAVDDLGKVRDCRAVGGLLDLLAREPPVPVISNMGSGRRPLSADVVPCLTGILSVYPGVVPTGQMPSTRDAWLEWWQRKGRHLRGLDIRESSDKAWVKRYPPGSERNREPPGVTPLPRVSPERNQDDGRQPDGGTEGDSGGGALRYYREAFLAAQPHVAAVASAFSAVVRGAPVALDELARLTEANQAALALARKGLDCGECAIPVLTDMRAPVPFVSGMVTLGRLLVLEGSRYELEGAGAKAAASNVDALRLSRHIASARLSVAASFSLQLESAALRSLRQSLAKGTMSPEDFRSLLGRLVALGESPLSLTGTVHEECEVLRRSCATMEMSEMVSEVLKGRATAAAGEAAPPSEGPKESLLADLDAYDKTVAAWVHEGYRAARATAPPEPSHWVARNWLPRAGDLWLKELLLAADYRATALALALHGYAAQRGALPERLDELCPSYLPTLPLDPFAGKPFLYGKTGDAAEVRSTGPDLDDDEGKTSVASPGTWASPAGGDVVYSVRAAGKGR